VIVLDLDRGGAERVAAEVGGTPLVADLAQPEGLDGLKLAADVLVNNAGLQHVAPVEAFPPERFAAMVAAMLLAPFRLARAVLPRMYERGWGRVVNISSAHGLRASTRAPTWPPSTGWRASAR
jgi:3-hydroxybutyrate dehydrogenase